MMLGRKPLLRPKSVPIAWLLLGGVGLLVTMSLAIVLVTGFLAAGRNTVELLRDRTTDLMAILSSRVERYLEPAERHVQVVSEMIGREKFTFNASDIYRLRLSMAAIPEITGMAVALADGRTIRMTRDGFVARGGWSDLDLTQEIYDAIVASDDVYWLDPVWARDIDRSIIVVRRAIRDGDDILGFAATAMTTDGLSVFLAELSTPETRAFLLDTQNNVVAHPRLIQTGNTWDEDRMPTPAELGDPTLGAFVAGDFEDTSVLRGLDNLTAALVTLDDAEEQIVITRPFRKLVPLTWTIGVVASTEGAEVLFNRLYGILVAGLAVLALTLFLLWRVARSVRRPVAALAEASEKIRLLKLDEIPDPPETAVSELRDASAAFYSMVGALKWFETYVPRRLVVRLMETDQAEGYRARTSEVTVLFTDIPGFTSLAENKDAREVAEMLNAHFSLIARCVEAEDGTIDKYIGDSVMAFWGAPKRQEDHAARAIRAVKAVDRAIRAENEVRKTNGEPPIRIRIGLHSGQVIVGNIGAPGRVSYTIVGDTVNVANRLEQLGKEVDGDTEVVALASADTVEAADGAVEGAEDLGARTLRGLSQPIQVYRLV
jgi:class 3 adenylate cyclase